MRAAPLALLALALACDSPRASTSPSPSPSPAPSPSPSPSPSTSTSTSTAPSPSPPRGAYDPLPFGGPRPVTLYVPTKYAPSTPAPLVILLHGYGSSGDATGAYLGLRDVAESRTVLYAHPDGTVDSHGRAFWNATDTCCNFDHSPVDDSAYLAALVREIEQRYAVDPKRIYFAGHSNGGFMSYRMACDHADLVAGIASVAGAMWTDVKRCKPSAAVSVLEIHGTADNVITYDGGVFHTGFPPYPGAMTSVADWAAFDGCTKAGEGAHLDRTLAGAETSVTHFETGCRDGSAVELWTVRGAGHVPTFSSAIADRVLDFLLAHPKP